MFDYVCAYICIINIQQLGSWLIFLSHINLSWIILLLDFNFFIFLFFFFRLDSLFQSLAHYTGLRSASSDDWADKLNHVYTVLLLILSACVLITRQYVGSSISCWNPGEADKSHHITYAENYCWVSDTFVVSDDERFPNVDENVNHQRISYYQWIPFILIFQAFLFKLPNLIWRLFNGKAGINLEKLVALAHETQFGNYADREKIISHIAHYTNKWITINQELKETSCIKFRQQMAKHACFLCNQKEGTFLTGLYLVSKMFYFTNVIVQFYILDIFLWPEDFNGWDVVMKAFKTGRLTQSSVFPRVTFCDFQVRSVSKHQFRIQCVLPINMFNEKIFLMFWLWFLFVAVCTGLSLLKTIYVSICKKDYTHFAEKYLRCVSVEEDKGSTPDNFFKDFTMKYLKRDGIFVMKVIGRASTDIVVMDLMESLWNIYTSKPKRFNPILSTGV